MDKAPQTDMERRLMDQLKDGKFAKNAPVQSERRGCYYTTIPASIKHSNISGDELTALNLDKVIFWASCQICSHALVSTLGIVISTNGGLLGLIPFTHASCKLHQIEKLYYYLLMKLLYFSDMLAGECFGQELPRPRGFTLGRAAVCFHSIYGTTEKNQLL